MDWYQFPPLFEFDDVRGVTRAVYGLTLDNRDRFLLRLTQIQELLLSQSEQGESWQQFYVRSNRLQYLIKQCLNANGIQPDWVNLDMVDALLFDPGWLLIHNAPKAAATPQATPQSTEEILALISLQTQSIEEALQLAANVPAANLLEIATQRAKLQAPPETKQRDNLREFARQERLKARQQVGANGDAPGGS